MDGDSAEVVAHYDQLAEHWEEITQGPAKKHVLLPVFHSLLPDIAGLTILDAGCGDGYYASWFAEQGGDVTGIDLSEEMIAVARARYGDEAEFRQADMSERLAFEDDQFDLVVCQHVLSHIPSLETPLSEFARVLRPGGTLVVTTHHPFHDYLVARDEEMPDTHESLDKDLDPLVETGTEETQYHETERFQVYWGGSKESAPGTYYRRPMSDLVGGVLDAGLTLREVVEPTPDETFTAEYPELAAELRRRPSRSVCLRAER